MGLAVGFLFARRRAMPGVAALRHERLATDFAVPAVDPASVPRNRNRAIDTEATFDAANNMLRQSPARVADDGPAALFARRRRAPGQVFTACALSADQDDPWAISIPVRNPIGRIGGGHVRAAKRAIHALRINQCVAAQHFIIRNARAYPQQQASCPASTPSTIALCPAVMWRRALPSLPVRLSDDPVRLAVKALISRVTYCIGCMVGFHSRASRCASAIWSGVILAATSSRSSDATSRIAASVAL